MFARAVARICAGHFAPALGRIVYVRAGASARTALEVLRAHGLSAVPVFKSSVIATEFGSMPSRRCARETTLGFVDVMDAAGAVLHRALLDWDREAAADVGGIINFSGEDAFVAVTVEAPLVEVVAHFARGVHRVAVVAGLGARSRQLLSVISQGDFMLWAAAQFRSFGSLGRQSLRALGLTTGGVVAAASSDPARVALKTMLEGRLSGLPIVDDVGVLLTGISVSDCRYLASLDDAIIADELERACLDFVMSLRERRGAHPTPVYAVRADDSLEVAVAIMTAARVHRVFVVDHAYRPTAVVTMSDACRAILEYSGMGR